MKFREIFRLELVYQMRGVSIWLYFAALVFFAFVQTVGNFLPDARNGGYFLNAPLVIAEVTVFCSLFWSLVAAHVAGDAAARDVETGMHSLTYTLPIRKVEYLGGRFLAALVLNALILLAVPVGILLGVHSPEVETELRGTFRVEAYLTAQFFIALPNALVASAVQFSFANRSRRAVASYLGGLLLLVANASCVFLAEDFGLWESNRTGNALHLRGTGQAMPPQQCLQNRTGNALGSQDKRSGDALQARNRTGVAGNGGQKRLIFFVQISTVQLLRAVLRFRQI